MSDQDQLVAGRYRLERRIGSGAMGVVWQARDERLHRIVAVKQLLLPPGLEADEEEEARQRAQREGRIAARLQHPNAIAVFDVVEHEGQPCLIMEYLPSRSLAAVLAERGVLDPVEAARIGSHVATALTAAHAAGVVHRDIKPGNILLGDNGVVKITDFGISRAAGDVTVTKTGMLAGTPAYLAPEVAKGYDPGPASDVFSLGSMLYAMVEGEPPFGLGDNTLALLHAVAAGVYPPPRQAGALTPVLTQLLRTDPTNRPTMVQTQEALAALAAGRPSGMTATGATQAIFNAPHQAPTQVAGPGPHSGGRIGPPTGPGTRLDAAGYDAMPTQAVAPQERSHPAMPPPRGHDPEPPAKSNGRTAVLVGLGIVAAALVGVLLAQNLISPTGGDPGNNRTVAPLTDNPADETSSYRPTATTAASTTTAPSTTSAASSTATSTPTPTATSDEEEPETPTPSEVRSTAQTFFGHLPGDTGSAFRMLNQAGAASVGGRSAFDAEWAKYSRVEVNQIGTPSDGSVTAVLKLTPVAGPDGTTPPPRTESRTLQVVKSGGRTQISKA